MKINLLSQSVYNRISAGEVVENPASIVKELVENSIDSGANTIEIAIEQGGIKSIKVTDNGIGIEKDELYKTILPHATSKICNAEDLNSIATLGFRGEALASICAVSEMEIISKYTEAETGAIMRAKADEVISVEDYAFARGTSIKVSKLFFNTPARYKFLKSQKTEETNVTRLVSQIILSNPAISINYIVDGKQVFVSDGTDLYNAINTVYGAELNNKIVELTNLSNDNNISVTGYISGGDFSKPNHNYQTLIINGRIVTDQTITAVIQNAYGERLMKRCFPFYVIEIVMPFEDIDVNVHPNKKEVRFANIRAVSSAIYQSVKYSLEMEENQVIKENFQKINFIPQKQEGKPEQNTPTEPTKYKPIEQTNIDYNTKTNIEYSKETKANVWESVFNKVFGNDNLEINTNNTPTLDTINEKTTVKYNDTLSIVAKTNKNEDDLTESKPVEEITFAEKNPQKKYNYKLLGQLFNTYLLVEIDGNFYMIDQHATHERILYDKFMKIIGEEKIIPSQPLLLPYLYEDTASIINNLVSLAPILSKMGFEIEQFGDTMIKVYSIPLIFASEQLDFHPFFSDLAMESIMYNIKDIEVIKEKIATFACKSAIKGGYEYNNEQSKMVLDYFFSSGVPTKCPHGRPTFIVYSKSDVEKLFRRKL